MAKIKNDSLHGWDDEKIYFVEGETGTEYCVSDEFKLYDQLVQLCRTYFRENGIVKREHNA
jgi:hypothetical protein